MLLLLKCLSYKKEFQIHRQGERTSQMIRFHLQLIIWMQKDDGRK
jgi:hypothetical protein